MPRTAVIDSTALISLVHLDLASSLSSFFEVIYVPRSVQEEVNKKGRFRYRLKKLYRTGFFERCIGADRINVLLLRAELGKGESEALVQTQERRATYFIGDEKKARQIALNRGQNAIGTLRLLARLNLEGRAPSLPELVSVLRRDLGFRVADEIVRAAIAHATEPI